MGGGKKENKHTQNTQKSRNGNHRLKLTVVFARQQVIRLCVVRKIIWRRLNLISTVHIFQVLNSFLRQYFQVTL